MKTNPLFKYISIDCTKVFFALLLIMFFPSCNKQNIRRDIKKLYRVKIEIPDNMYEKHGERIEPYYNSLENATLVVWYDSSNCVSCNLKSVERWNRVFEFSEDSVHGFIPMIIFSPSQRDLFKFETNLKLSDFEYPIYIDYYGAFSEKNPQIANLGQNVFLIDRSQRIVLVGDPFHNSQMWNLYTSTIRYLGANKRVDCE